MKERGPDNSLELMADFEARAERAYAAMYDAEPRDCKDLKDDACACLARAVEIAEALGRADDAARLKARAQSIRDVYASQFRGIGR